MLLDRSAGWRSTSHRHPCLRLMYWKGATMIADTVNMNLSRASVCLDRGRGMSLRDAAGVVLTTLTGRAWLTMEGDVRDIDLRPGAAYRIERDGLTLVSALEATCVEVRVPRGNPSPWRASLDAIWNWLAAAGAARARAKMGQGLGRFQL